MIKKDFFTPELNYFSSDLAYDPLNRLLNIETDCLALRQELISIIVTLNEDESPFNTVSIINSLAVISLSERMDDIASLHAHQIIRYLGLDIRVLALENVSETKNWLLQSAINQNPYLSPFKKSLKFIGNWVLEKRQLEQKLPSGSRLRSHQIDDSHNNLYSHHKQKMHRLNIDAGKYIQSSKNLVGSLELPLLVHWALFYNNVYNETKDTEKLFDSFLNGLIEQNAIICRRKGNEFQIVCSSEHYFGEGEFMIHPVSKINRIKSITSSDSDFSKFEDLYTRYITGLSNCLTFANCSGKLTSVEQLYHRPPKFYPQNNKLIHKNYPFLVGDMKSNLDKIKVGDMKSNLDKIKDYHNITTKKLNFDSESLKLDMDRMFSEFTKVKLDEIEDLENKISSPENEGDKHAIAGFYHDLGKAYRGKEPKKAIISYEKCIEIRRDIGDSDGLSKSYNNMGLVYWDLARLSSKDLDAADETQEAIDDAEGYFNLSLDLKRKENLNTTLGLTLRNMARLKTFAGGDSDEIISTFDEALALSMDGKDKMLQSNISADIVNYYQKEFGEDIIQEKSRFDGRLIEDPRFLDGSEIIDLNLNHCKSFTPFVIEGSAGMGKTIVMTQLALKYVNEIEKKVDLVGIEEMKNLAMPIYIKGARIGKSDFQLGGEIKLAEMICNSNPEINKYLTVNEIRELLDLWNKFSIYHLSNYSFFVDAVDEIPNLELAMATIELICGGSVNPRNGIQSLRFISTRPSHADLLRRKGRRTGHAKLRSNYYSREELSKLMPIKLCDAWGITRELTETYQKEFDSYDDILIHPLFVGWFCFLIIEDKLSSLNLVDNDVDGDHEIFNSNLEYKKNVLLNSIIEIGIEASLKRKERSVKDQVLFTNLVKRFVSISFHYSISDPKIVFQIIEEQQKLEISGYDKQSLMHECGILFLTGENIVWTHTTIPEIIYAEFFFEQEQKLYWGPMKTSKPVLYRYALSEFKSGNFENYSVAVLTTFHKFLPNPEFSLSVVKLGFDYADYKIIGQDKNSELVNLVSTESYTLHHLVNLYLDSLSKPSSFAINLNFIVHKYIRESELGEREIEGFSSTDSNPSASFLGSLLEYWDPRSALSLKLYNVSNSAFGKDTLPFNMSVPPEFLERSRINSSTKISDILGYYREISGSIETDDSILDLHEISTNYDGIFTGLNLKTVGFDPKAPIMYLDLDNETNLHSHINELHFEISYGKLFGSEKVEKCIEKLWEELVDLEPIILGEEYVKSVPRKVTDFITSLHVSSGGVLEQTFDFQIEIEANFSEDDDLQLVDKGRLLMPFVRECLNHLKGENSVLSSYIEESDFWMPYEMIKSYASNLD